MLRFISKSSRPYPNITLSAVHGKRNFSMGDLSTIWANLPPGIVVASIASAAVAGGVSYHIARKLWQNTQVGYCYLDI